MEIKNFKVGQEVAIRRKPMRGPSAVVSAIVTKVGRKYVYARMAQGANNAEIQFENGDAYENCLTEHSDPYAPTRFLYPSLRDADDAKELEQLQRWLGKAARWDVVRTFTLEQLRAVKQILDPEGGFDNG